LNPCTITAHTLPTHCRIYKGRYGGYAGEAAPEKVYELLLQDDNIFLVDIRPEETREKEGLPQLKLGARFKVATFPMQVRRALTAVTAAAAAAAAPAPATAAARAAVAVALATQGFRQARA
jgi:hypothetical protein